MSKSTMMYRKVKCLVCEYEQTDSVSYYRHAKMWKANHDLDKCSEIRKSKKDYFTEMFSESLTALSNLTITK